MIFFHVLIILTKDYKVTQNLSKMHFNPESLLFLEDSNLEFDALFWL